MTLVGKWLWVDSISIMQQLALFSAKIEVSSCSHRLLLRHQEVPSSYRFTVVEASSSPASRGVPLALPLPHGSGSERLRDVRSGSQLFMLFVSGVARWALSTNAYPIDSPARSSVALRLGCLE